LQHLVEDGGRPLCGPPFFFALYTLAVPARTALVFAIREIDMDDDAPGRALGRALRLGATAAFAAVVTAAVVIAAGRALFF